MLRQNLPKLFGSLICVLILCLWSPSLFAQGNGTITGTVTDPTGAVIANAAVKILQDQTGRELMAESNTDGAFVFPAMHPSRYSLSVTKAGFKTFTQPGIVLQADQTLTINVKLEVGAASTVVVVSEAVPQVDTTTGTLSQVIDERRIVDLPLNGRNAASLITLVSGVVDAANEGNGVDQGVGKTFPAAVVTSSNGTLPNQANYLLNGGNNVDEMTNANAPFPMPDAVQEFSVQTSNYAAEYGQSAGAMVNIITKSGTSSFHGSGFEFLRNGYFNAKNYFATKADTMHRNQFGGTFGGPVMIPHLFKAKNTQFFYGYQRTMIRSSSTANQTTAPTMAEEGRTGTGYADFGNLCTGGWNASNLCNTTSQRILNPFTNVAYALNRIPTSDFDPAAVELQKHFPVFTGTEAAGKIGGTVNFLRPSIQDFEEHIVRLDHQFSSRDLLFGHYFYDNFNQPGVFDPEMLSSYQSYFSTRYQNALVSESHTFSPTLLNTLTLNYQRETSLRGGPPGSQNITGYGVNNIWQPGTGPYMAVSVTGYFGASSSAFAGWYRNNYTLDDGLHWVKGNHNFAFGGHVEASKFDVTNVYQSYGGFTSGTIGSYINAYANFLMGFLTSFQQGNFEQVNDRNHFPSLYAQDSWKVNRRLVLNYGLRWELFAPWHNKVGNLQLFDPAAYAANKGTSLFSTLPAGLLLTPGDPGVPKDGTDKKNKFMPRFGFAYDIFGDGKTVVRGGAGMFYQDRMPGFFNLNQAANVPNTISIALSNPGMYSATPGANPGGPLSNPYCVGGCGAKGTPYANPFPFTLPFASNKVFPNQILVEQYDPKFEVPVTYTYNLTVERQLGPTWAARIAYVGSGSRHQFVNLELNPAVNTGSGLNVNARRPYNTAPTVGPCASMTGCALSYSQIVTTAMIGSANFHSFQATLDKKMSHGLYLLANLTWSKTTDDMPQATRVSNTENLNAGESYVYPWYPANATGIPAAARVADIKALDRGLSDIDHPIVFSLSYSWDVPKVSGNGLLKAIVNGWRISGLSTYRSGDSLTVWAGTDRSLTGLGQDRAQYDTTKAMYYSSVASGTSNCTAGKSCVQWFNPTAFSTPASAGAGTGFGNVVKGTLRGPSRANWDASITRSFPVWRETHLDFRVEYFNLLNHTQLRNPATAQMATSNATFGTISSAYDPRIAQFALKYVF